MSARLIKAPVKQQTARSDDEVDELNDVYSETVDANSYIEEDYLVDADDSDGNTYLIEYVNDEEGIEEHLANEMASNGLIEDMTEDVETSSDEYSCNHCGMNFKNVNEHIQKYHSNDEVVIDMEEYSSDVKAEGISIDSSEFDVDTDANILPDDDETEYRSALLQIEDENNIIESTSDIENGDVYDFEETIEGEDESQPLVTEMVVVNSDKAYKCQRCGLECGTLRKLSSHLLAEHGKEITSTSPRRVKQVKKETKTPKRTISQPDVEHICEVCNTCFSSSKSLKLHARIHLPVKSKTLEETIGHDIDPLQSDSDAIRRKFYCGICCKSYDKAFQEVHMQMHNGEEKFNCGICNKVFPNEESINMHMNAHQDTRVIRTKAELSNVRLPFGCQYCGKEFARPHEKVKHERVHTGEKPYECELCGKCFRVSYCLTIHMRTHTDARPYVCPHCNKRFKAQSVYNHHLLTHSDERNYQCPYCPKTFKTSVQLSGHKNSHTKPFTCTDCNRPFGSLYAVRTHMESHKRPNHNLKHICTICGAKYARRFALNDHMKEQHKDANVEELADEPKKTTRRVKKVKKVEIDYNVDEIDLEPGQSILSNIVEQEITISEIEQFDNEEEVIDIDWLTK